MREEPVLTANLMTDMHAASTFARLRPIGLVLLFSVFATSSSGAAAQTLCSEVCEQYVSLLQAPERELIGTFRQIEKVAKPLVGPRNTRGRWKLRDVIVGSEVFDAVFFMSGGRVQRVDFYSTATEAECRTRKPWAATVSALEQWQGLGTVSGEFNGEAGVQQAAHWGSGNREASVYLLVSPEDCKTKITFKNREVKDASSL